MKLTIMNTEKHKTGDKELPSQFSEEYRPDLIHRAVLALQSSSRQAYGSLLGAGKRRNARLSKRRRDYKTSYGIGIGRVARKIHSGKGVRFHWVGASTPQTVGGRRAHPPKIEKQWEEKINVKERRKAIRSAIAATVNSQVVKERGHVIPPEYPFIIDVSFESLSKTKNIEKALLSLGFGAELERSSQTKIRAGKGKYRGRKYIQKKGLLIVVSELCPAQAASQNIPGVDIVSVKALNTSLLAPGAMAGRVTLWTAKAIEVMEKEHLFQ